MKFLEVGDVLHGYAKAIPLCMAYHVRTQIVPTARIKEQSHLTIFTGDEGSSNASRLLG